MGSEDEPIDFAMARQRLKDARARSMVRPNIPPETLAAAQRAMRLRPDLWGLPPKPSESVRDPIHLYQILFRRFTGKLLRALGIR